MSVVLALSLSALAASAQALAADAEPAPGDKPATLIDQVVVTGSRIPRASLEGPSPVTVISGEEIDKQGFRSAFDALAALSQNTGVVQGEDYGNTFTPAANVINLRGLGPNHTLVLINGRRQ
ncbi:TonB-dependent receptor plug domain-containing protein, partial [Lysobacter sp. 2RAB21]